MDIYDDKHKPEPKRDRTIWRLVIEDENAKPRRVATIYVGVDEMGMLTIERNSRWFAMNVVNRYDLQSFETQMQIFDWLVEWELARWCAIGPEDREIFATQNLDPEWGIPV